MEAVTGFLTAHWLAVSLVCFLTVLVAYLSGVLQRVPADAPPLYSEGIPILGTFLAFSKGPVAFVHKTYKKMGGAFSVRFFGQRMTFVVGPDWHKSFFDAREDDASQAEVYRFMTPVFGKGIVYDAPIKQRLQQIKFVAHALKSNALVSYVPKIIKEATMFADSWKDSGEVVLMREMSRLTILTAASTLMGKEIREHLFADVAKVYQDLDEGITPLSVFFPNAPIPQHFKRNRARKEMVKLFSKVIQQRRASPNAHDDCLSAFMTCKYPDGTTLNDDAITGLMIALLFAGQHTSSITSTWTLMFIMHNPRVLAKVLDEQRRVLGSLDVSEPLTYDKLKQFEYLACCIKEALRMWPPLVFVMRKAKRPLKLSNGVTIPAGDTVFGCPANSMRVPEAFSNPDTYDPDRFMPDRAEDKKKPYTFIGFGGGIHACLGENFAMLQVAAIASLLLRKYELTPLNSKMPEADYTAMVVGPTHSETRVRYTLRKGSAAATAAAAAGAGAAASVTA